jgi:hypothetical protein
VQKLSTTLHQTITSASLRVYPDQELEREILGLRVVETSSGWRFDHRAGAHSDRAVALAMALAAAQRAGTSQRARILSPDELGIRLPIRLVDGLSYAERALLFEFCVAIAASSLFWVYGHENAALVIGLVLVVLDRLLVRRLLKS